MAELEPNSINPLVGDFYLFAALSSDAGVSALVGNRIVPAREGFEPSEFLSEGQSEAQAWPFVTFGPSESGQFEMFAGSVGTLLDAPYLVRAWMREDFVSEGDIEDVTGAICEAMQRALRDAGAMEIVIGDRAVGVAHGIQVLPALHRAIYGERGRRVSEIGLHVCVLAN